MFASLSHSSSGPARAWGAGLCLLGFWLAAAWLVDPAGEFPLNDDWSYWQALMALLHQGRLASTGWAGGGIALIVHLLWGGLFTSLFGESFTALRLSVVVMGLLGSGALFMLLRSVGASAGVALLGALTLAANPLFFSQSFTFMTDVTATSLVAMALLALHGGMGRGAWGLVCLGLLLCAAAVLTRQLALVLAVGFLAATWLHPAARALGRWRLTLLTVVLVCGPWLAWEWMLAASGSTPLGQHQLVRRLIPLLLSGDPQRYLDFAGLVAGRLVAAGLGITTFFLLPLLLLGSRPSQAGAHARRGWLIYVAACLAVEGAALAGFIPWPSQVFQRLLASMGFGNVLMNLGIGPLLFKDTYLLGHSALRPLPPMVWDLVGFITAPAMLKLVAALARSLRDRCGQGPAGFIALTALVSGLVYLAGLAVIGFHDRYLMLLILLWIVCLVARPQGPLHRAVPLPRLAAAGALVVLAAVWAVGGTHDFMAIERAAQQARRHAVRDLGVNPCHLDGGFAFNGLHCHHPSFRPRPGLSWWWVQREDYLVALGRLAGYQVVRAYPARRWLAPDTEVYLLKPD